VELFDAAENALEPDSQEARAAQVAFDSAVQQLFEGRVANDPEYRDVSQPLFKAKLRTLCRQYLSKN